MLLWLALIQLRAWRSINEAVVRSTIEFLDYQEGKARS